MNKIITENYRRFGIEIELNTTTDIIRSKDEIPDGAPLVGSIIQKVAREPVELHGWHHTNNNNCWVIKPDGSCGMEICSPILKGCYDLTKLVKVVDVLSKTPHIQADQRCSFHVHVNMEDLSNYEIGTILAWWIKCEAVFFDSLPSYRRCSRHTQLIGMSELFHHDRNYKPDEIIEKLSVVKYHSVNAYHMRMKRRKSVEFRIAENAACLDPFFVKNWIRLLLHFVEMMHQKMPKNYASGDPNSGLLWLNPKQVFRLLRFNSPQLSPGLKQTRDWFLQRLYNNIGQAARDNGLWQLGTRTVARQDVFELSRKFRIDPTQDRDTLLYSGELLI